MASQAKVIIKAEDNLTKAVNSAKASLLTLEGAALKMGSVLKNALGFTAVAASIKKLGDAVAGCFNDFEDADRKYKQLEIALGGGEAFSKAKDTIAELSRVTLESKGAVETMVAELAALGKSSDEIDKISKAAVYLSNVTGKDLASSMTTLLNTYNGTTTQLKKLGFNVDDLTQKELKNGAAVDRVIESLQIYSEELARSDTRQNLNNIANTWGDIKQSVGDLINFSFSPMIKSFDYALLSIQKRFDSWIQDVKVVLGGFPEFFNKLSLTISSMVDKFFSYDNVKTLTLAIANFIPKTFENALKRVAIILDLFLNAIPTSVKAIFDGLGNYALYIVTNVCNDIGLNLTELVNNIGAFLTESPIGKIINQTLSTVINGIKLVSTIISNIPQLITLVAENSEEIFKASVSGVKNWFFSSLSDTFNKLGTALENLNLLQRFEDIKVNIQNFFGRINSYFEAISNTAKDTFRFIGEVIQSVFSWSFLETSVTVLFKNLGTLAVVTVKEIFINIPTMIGSVFEGAVRWIINFGVKLKNTLIEAVENFIKDAGNSLKGTWVDKLFGLGSTLSNISFNIDREGEDALKEKALSSFASIGDNFEKSIDDAVNAAGLIKENNKEISALLSSIDKIKVSTPEYKEIKAEEKGNGRFVQALFSLSDKFAEKIEDNSTEWRDLTLKFSSLISPSIEKWEKEAGTTFGEKLLTWTQKSSDEYLESSKKSFSIIGKTLSEWGISFSDEVEKELESLWGGISTYMGDLFGDDLSEFSSWLQGFLNEHKSAVVTSVDNATNKITKSLNKNNVLSNAWGSATSSSVKNESGEELSIFSKESALANITADLSSSFSALFSSLGPVIEAVCSGAWWLAALSVILEGFVGVIIPAINTLLAPVMDALKLIGQSLALLIVPVLDSLTPALTFLQKIIVEAVTPALQILSPVISLVSTLLDALSPIISLVGKAFTILMSPVQFVADLFSWLGRWLEYLGECVGVCAWNLTHWFDQRSFPSNPGGFKSDAFSGLGERLAAWDSLSASKGAVMDVANQSVSSSTAISAAGYQGGAHITINIYQQAPVVGDGGMRAFAQMVKDEFDELDYYGVTG